MYSVLFQTALKWRGNNIEMMRIDTNYKNYANVKSHLWNLLFLKGNFWGKFYLPRRGHWTNIWCLPGQTIITLTLLHPCLDDRGLTRWPKSFPQGQQFLKTRSQKARRCIQRSHPSSSARELLYRANWTRKRGQFATLSWFGCGGSWRIWKFSYCNETGIDPSIQINWMTR